MSQSDLNFQGFFPSGIIEIYTIYTIDPIGKHKTIEYLIF